MRSSWSTPSTTGATCDRRPVALALLGTPVTTEITLARRDEMGFRMLVGREALRQGFVVDTAHSYLGGKPGKTVRRRNRRIDDV